MPTLAVPHLFESLKSLSPFQSPILRLRDRPDAQGVEGQRISDAMESVFRHWSERAEVLTASLEDPDEYSYASVPPNRTFCVKTHYRFIGKGEPLPFDLDEDE